MDFKEFLSQVAHPFVLYVLFGTFASYLIIRLFFRFPRFQSARVKVYMLFVPLLLPVSAFIVFQTILTKQCSLTIDYKHQTFNTINQWLCTVGDFLATYVTPLFILTGILALVKAVVSLIACNRLVRRYGYSSPEAGPRLFAILENLCHRAGITIPKVIVTGDSYARSFTFGFIRPVIVISQGLVNELDEDELEAVLAHELAHIIRGDSVLNWITVFLRDLMFFSPVVYWLFRDLYREKEHATDDITIALSDKPFALAGALIKVWKMSPRNFWSGIALDNFMPYPHFAAGEGVLEGRVKRIINRDPSVDDGLGRIVFPVLLIVLLSFTLLYLVC